MKKNTSLGITAPDQPLRGNSARTCEEARGRLANWLREAEATNKQANQLSAVAIASLRFHCFYTKGVDLCFVAMRFGDFRFFFIRRLLDKQLAIEEGRRRPPQAVPTTTTWELRINNTGKRWIRITKTSDASTGPGVFPRDDVCITDDHPKKRTA